MKSVLLIASVLTAVQCAPEFSERAQNFSIELLRYSQLETHGHIVISPFGMKSLMTGITIGATGNSRDQIARAFILPKNTKSLIEGYKNLLDTVLSHNRDGVNLISMNFIFVDKNFTIRSDFRTTITSDFGIMMENLNFKNSQNAAKLANKIIQGSGANVSNVLRSDDFTGSRMILTNVISFKGLWSQPFNTTDTIVEPFYDENKNEIGKVNMMYQKAQFAYSNIKEMNAYVLELPYGGDGKYCMLILLPYPKFKVSDVYQKLATISFPDIFARLQHDIDVFSLDDVNVKLPRFKMTSNIVMNKSLKSMGVYDIFDPNLASFEGITNDEIFVTKIVHKADIEVTESGTVASAVSTAHITDRISTPNFHANRPFIYFVMHKPSATVIFSGIYSKPSVF